MKKVMLLYVFIVVIPVFLIGLTAEKVIYEYIRNDYSASIGEAVKQIAKNIEFRKSSYELLIRQIAMNGELSERIVAEYQIFTANGLRKVLSTALLEW